MTHASEASRIEPLVEPRLPTCAPAAHKGDRGRVLVLAGATGFTGAARMAAEGALAGGVGLLTVATPDPVRAEVAAADASLMTRGLRSTLDGTFAFAAAREALALAGELAADAVVLGPGISKHAETVAFARRLLHEMPLPCVVDADALNACALNVPGVPAADFGKAAGPRVHTPHPGECGRLIGRSAGAVQRDRVGAIRALHARVGGVVVLKGLGTLVFDGSRLRICPTGNAGLAVGGSGDVLAGLLGAFLARRMAPFDAACAAVYLHGRAADRIVEDRGAGPVRHRELADEIEALCG